MRSKLKFAAAAALAISVLFAPSAVAAELAGVWNILTQSNAGPRKSVLTVDASEAGLSGYIKGERGEAPIDTIAVDGDSFTFVVQMDTAIGAIDLTYKGTLSGDAMEGTIETPMGSRAFTGTRKTD